MKKLIAIVAAIALAIPMAACGAKSSQQPSATAAAANLGGKAYTEQTFSGASAEGLLPAMIDSKGALVTVSQTSGASAVVTQYDAQGNKKSSVNSDVTDTVGFAALGTDDSVWLMAEPTGGLYTAHQLDATGKTVKTVELANMKVPGQVVIGATGAPAASAAPTETPAATAAPSGTARTGRNGGNGGNGMNFNMRSRVSSFLVAPDGSLLVAVTGSGVQAYDASGKAGKTYGSNNMLSQMALNEKGQLIVYSMSAGGGQNAAATLKTYDIANGSEAASMDASAISSMQSMFYDKAGKRLLYLTDQDVRVLSADGKTSAVLVSLSDFSLLDGSRSITGFAVDGQGAVYLEAYNSSSASATGSGSSGAVTTGGGGFGGAGAFGGGGFGGGGFAAAFGGSSSANETIRLGLVDASTIKARKTITMAALNSSTILDQAISAFQIANPDYKISLKVYNTQVQNFRRIGGGNSSQFDTSSLVQAFNTDLMSGKGADIIVLDNMPYYKYVDKGLLTDLTKLMADKGLDLTQYYSNILDACKINGKLYGVPMSFSYSVLVGKTAYMPASDSPTVADFVAKAKALPKGISAFNNQSAMNVFNSYLRFCYSDLVDTASHTAHFDSPEFIQMLKDFKDLIGQNTSTDTNQGAEAGLASGNVAYNVTNMSNPTMLATMRAIVGSDLKISNVPTLSGSGAGAFTASLMVGLNASSKNQDAAWEFLKTMLGSDIQGSGRLSGYPILKSATQKIVDNMKSGTGLNAGGMRMVLRVGDQQVEVKPLTDADYQSILDTLPKLNKLQAIDPNIQQVLTEELPAFFSGNKTAEDVASAVQNRVNTIINE